MYMLLTTISMTPKMYISYGRQCQLYNILTICIKHKLLYCKAPPAMDNTQSLTTGWSL